MKIFKYGITLTRLNSSDLDFVFQKLQPDEKCPIAVPDKELSYDQKQDWFNSINNHHTVWFLVEFEQIKKGIIIVKNINWESRTCDTQHYYWDEITNDSQIPFLSSLALLEVGFCYLNWDTTYTMVYNNNPKLKTLAQKLGYKPSESNNSNKSADYQIFCLSSGDFNINYNSLVKENTIQISGKTGEGYLLLEPIDYESGIAGLIENNFLESGVYLHRRGISGSRMYFR